MKRVAFFRLYEVHFLILLDGKFYKINNQLTFQFMLFYEITFSRFSTFKAYYIGYTFKLCGKLRHTMDIFQQSKSSAVHIYLKINKVDKRYVVS